MTTDSIQLARQRLAHSRLALTQQMSGRRQRVRPTESHEYAEDESHAQPESGNRWLNLGGRAVRTWWSRHPANTVAAFAEPAIAHYARSKPLQLLGIAAAVGAVAVVTRPWRLVSITALLAAGIRASDIANAATALLSSNKDNAHAKDQR